MINNFFPNTFNCFLINLKTIFVANNFFFFSPHRNRHFFRDEHLTSGVGLQMLKKHQTKKKVFLNNYWSIHVPLPCAWWSSQKTYTYSEWPRVVQKSFFATKMGFRLFKNTSMTIKEIQFCQQELEKKKKKTLLTTVTTD